MKAGCVVRVGFAVVGLVLTAGTGWSQAVTSQQQSKPTVVSETPSTTQAKSDRKVPLLSRPITLADFSGMKPKPELEKQLAVVADFVQNQPVDGAAPTEKTVAYMGRTAAALYVVFTCFDDHPELIRGHLARRENIQQDDTAVLLLDPFQDRRRGVLFKVNSVGVQADAAWTDNNDPDYSYDLVWDSEGRVTRQGWMAMIVVPFRSLRFRPSDWGVVMFRKLPRNSEVDYWPRIAQNISGTLTQEGTLHGIEGVTGSHNIQLNPYGLAQNEKTLNSVDPLNPYFSDRKVEATAGGDAKVVIRDSIVVDATINPDFSQVESDQPQFTVNQRYPVFFPELRPFFLENANYFTTPIDLVYTRNIVHPELGARVTGKLGKTNLGLLAIDDRAPGEAVGQGDPLFGRKALFAVGRVSQDIGKAGSNVGVTYTDEEFGGGWNRVGGLDFTARLDDHWTVSGQMVESSTKGSSDTAGSAVVGAPVTPATYSAGPATDVQVVRSGHAFNLQSEYEDVSQGFVTQVGYLQTANIRTDHTHANYQWYPKHSVVQSYGLETDQHVSFDHQGNRVQHYSTFDPFVTLPRNIIVAPLLGQNSDTLGPQDGYALVKNRNLTENFAGLVVKGQPFAQLSANIVATYGGNPNYNPPAGKVPSLLHEDFVQALVTVSPIRQLTADNTFLLDRNFSAESGQFVFENEVFRTKVNYQFTRAFSARAIVEYDSLHVNPAETSLTRTKQVQTQALLTWLPHPGTAIYVGYNSDLQNYSHTLCSKLGSMCDPTEPVLPRGPGYLNDGRQFFVKASYLLRF